MADRNTNSLARVGRSEDAFDRIIVAFDGLMYAMVLSVK